MVATVRTFKPYADIDEYAVKMFENGGRGIGDKGKDNGLLIVVAVDDRQVRIEVGYDLEQFITDGFAGETIRDVITPQFRSGNYGAGLLAGVTTIVNRIAQSVAASRCKTFRLRLQPRRITGSGFPWWIIIIVIIIVILNSRSTTASPDVGPRTVERVEQRHRTVRRRRWIRRRLRRIRWRRWRWRWRWFRRFRRRQQRRRRSLRGLVDYCRLLNVRMLKHGSLNRDGDDR